MAEVSPDQNVADEDDERSDDEEPPVSVPWGKMQEAVDVLLQLMPEKGVQFDHAEEIDKLLHRFKRLIISSKTASSKQKSLESYFVKRNKGKGRAD